jgi:hypothetical protein
MASRSIYEARSRQRGALCGDGSVIVVVSYVPVDQRRLSPGPRKIKQVAPLNFCSGTGSGNDRLFGVLPELICSRHWHTSVCPDTSQPQAGPLRVPCREVCIELYSTLCVFTLRLHDANLGQVLTDFRQQLARAVRFRHIFITASRTRFLFLPTERIGGDRDDRDRT